MAEVTLYCCWCGRKLVYRGKRINSYYVETGEPLYHYTYACPMKRLLLWHDHAIFTRDEEGKLQKLHTD